MAVFALITGVLAIPAFAAVGTTELVSVRSDGTQGNSHSSNSSISANGRYVAFHSFASDLAPGDGNKGGRDVFVHDRQTDITTRVSVASDGTPGNEESRDPSISANGRYVAFDSDASNLIEDDTNDTTDVFVHDRQTGDTTRVSVASGGTPGNGDSSLASISADGSRIAFDSSASNLVAGDTNDFLDVFVHDLDSAATTRVSVASGGTQANNPSFNPSISADGYYIAFYSVASNLVVGDSNDVSDVFVHDVDSVATTRVSVASGGTQANNSSYDPSISTDGRFVAFYSNASNLVASDSNDWSDVFVRDIDSVATTRVSVASDGTQANGPSDSPSITPDGLRVAFESSASNLVTDDSNKNPDIFVHDRGSVATTRVSVATGDTESNNSSYNPSISTNGRFVAFESNASNLVSGDTNGANDVFVHDRDPDTDPPQTTVTGPNQTTNRRPTFRLGSDERGSSFSCKLDNARFKACDSPYRPPRLDLGRHVLKVKATDPAGNTDATPAKKEFRVKKNS